MIGVMVETDQTFRGNIKRLESYIEAADIKALKLLSEIAYDIMDNGEFDKFTDPHRHAQNIYQQLYNTVTDRIEFLEKQRKRERKAHRSTSRVA